MILSVNVLESFKVIVHQTSNFLDLLEPD